MKLKDIDSIGIAFIYYGDYVWWIWPCRRYYWKHRYLSSGFEGYFSSLKELKQEWINYENALIKVNENATDNNPF